MLRKTVSELARGENVEGRTGSRSVPTADGSRTRLRSARREKCDRYRVYRAGKTCDGDDVERRVTTTGNCRRDDQTDWRGRRREKIGPPFHQPRAAVPLPATDHLRHSRLPHPTSLPAADERNRVITRADFGSDRGATSGGYERWRTRQRRRTPCRSDGIATGAEPVAACIFWPTKH